MSAWLLAGWPKGCPGADIWRLGGGFGCLWPAFGCRGAAYAAYCRKRCIWCCLVGHRVAYGLIWGICGGAFGCRCAAFGCTGAAYTAYGSIRCIWLLAGWPQGAHRSESIHPLEGKMLIRGYQQQTTLLQAVSNNTAILQHASCKLHS